ncbi:MAG: gliding motility lipoprotein GldD, partial [Flavobacteriales bacterium]|nr:gliding motility lipoprotein GldD [Flavobacteriales bacterium]
MNFIQKLILCLGFLLFSSCEEEYFPKPFGHFRIDINKANYKDYSNCSYTLSINDMARVLKKKSNKCWVDVYYPKFKA